MPGNVFYHLQQGDSASWLRMMHGASVDGGDGDDDDYYYNDDDDADDYDDDDDDDASVPAYQSNPSRMWCEAVWRCALKNKNLTLRMWGIMLPMDPT